MEKAYFKNIRNEILSLLANAKDDVLVAMAWFTNDELFKALLSCLERGVSVELIILDNSINYMDYAPDFNELIEHGGKLRIAGLNLGFMHHKFCVIDGVIAITGSYNWTYYAETRNIENIVITDLPSIVSSYKEEFNRLMSATELASKTPRLSWSEIEKRDDVDFRELNYEIGTICKARNLPNQKVIKTETKVQIIETKRTPYSKYCIGIKILEKEEEREEDQKFLFDTFIPRHVKLPFKSETKSYFFNSEKENDLPCQFVYSTQNEIDEWQTIKDIDIMQIVNGIKDINLQIKFSMEFGVDGSLRVDISCLASGQKMMISTLVSDLVKYE